ncbi:MAG: AAA family ATPase [candidate division Zixibacteria bacterium]
MLSELYIKSIRFENFGPFNDLDITFEPGINQIIGPNESGKTVMMKGLMTAISVPADSFDSTNSPNSMISSSTCLSVVISNCQLNYLLIRNYAQKTDKLLMENGEEFTSKSVEEELCRIFGKGYLSRLSELIYFSSYSSHPIEGVGELLRFVLEEPVFESYDPAGADKAIQDEVENLENGTGDDLNSLQYISNKISERLKKESSIETSLDHLKKKNAELESIRDQAKELDSEISQLKCEIEGAVEYGQINNRMDDLQLRLENHLSIYSRASQISDDLDRIEKELDRLNVPEADEMEGFCRQKEALTEVIDAAKDKMDDLIILRNNSGRGFALTSLLLVLMCFVYVFQNNGYLETGFISQYIPVAIMLVLGFWFFRLGMYSFRQSRKTRATKEFRAEVARLDGLYGAINSKYGLGAADPVEALQGEIRRRQILEMGFENLSGTIGHLSEDKGMEYLSELKGKMEAELAELNKKLSSVKKYAGASNRIPELEEELTARRVRLNPLNERITVLAGECQDIARLESELKELDKEIEEFKGNFKDINEKIEVLKITRLALNRAANRIIENTYEEYNNHASGYIRRLTSGRHDGVRFRRDIQTLEARSNNSQPWLEVSQFESSSLKDVTELSIFLSMVSSNQRISSLPLFFYQADSRFDMERRNNLYKILNQMSSSRQIIYLGTEKINALGNSHSINLESLHVQYALV